MTASFRIFGCGHRHAQHVCAVFSIGAINHSVLAAVCFNREFRIRRDCTHCQYLTQILVCYGAHLDCCAFVRLNQHGKCRDHADCNYQHSVATAALEILHGSNDSPLRNYFGPSGNGCIRKATNNMQTIALSSKGTPLKTIPSTGNNFLLSFL